MRSYTRFIRSIAPVVTRTRNASPHRRHQRSAVAGLIATLVVLAGAIPAQAQVIEHERFSFTDEFGDVVCGVPVRHEVLVSGVAHLRVGKGDSASFFFELFNRREVETLTNEANGNFVQIEHYEVRHDVKATHVSGSIFMVTTIFVGQPILIRDMSGRVVSRDRGVIRETYLWDTLGDDTPGGEFVDRLSVQVSGPHSLLAPDFDEESFCAIVRPLLLG